MSGQADPQPGEAVTWYLWCFLMVLALWKLAEILGALYSWYRATGSPRPKVLLRKCETWILKKALPPTLFRNTTNIPSDRSVLIDSLVVGSNTVPPDLLRSMYGMVSTPYAWREPVALVSVGVGTHIVPDHNLTVSPYQYPTYSSDPDPALMRLEAENVAVRTMNCPEAHEIVCVFISQTQSDQYLPTLHTFSRNKSD